MINVRFRLHCIQYAIFVYLCGLRGYDLVVSVSFHVERVRLGQRLQQNVEGVVCRHDLLTLDSTASGVEGGTHGLLLCPTERGPAACIGRGGQDGRVEMTLC